MHYDSVMIYSRIRLMCILLGIYYIHISLWTVHKVDEGSLVLHVFILEAFTFTLLYDNKPVAPQHVFCYSGAWGELFSKYFCLTKYSGHF